MIIGKLEDSKSKNISANITNNELQRIRDFVQEMIIDIIECCDNNSHVLLF